MPKKKVININKFLKQDSSKFQLIDTKEPNLFREYFPYTEIPRIKFDNTIVLPSMPDEIFITDTTFRDGQQARPPYSAEQIAHIFELLHRLGGPNGVIRKSEFFLYSDKDKKAVELCKEKGFEFPIITGWIRAHKEDFKLVKEMELKETGILTSVSDYHIFLKMHKTRKEILKDYLEIIEAAIENNIVPRCHFEDITRADIFGFVIPFTQKLMKIQEQTKIPILIRLCDTMGYGVPFPNAALPRGVPKLVRTFVDEVGVPPENLEWHGHNDFHKVLINATTAWLYGCAAANGTIFGFGERTGNPPIEALIIDYISIAGNNNAIDTTVITEIKNYFEQEIGFHIPPNYPFVGSEFNITRAGIHADGLIKNEEIYNVFDTTKILNRPPSVAINDKSGAAGIAHWINSHFGLTGNKVISKHHPGVQKIFRKVNKMYDQGRTTALSSEEMEKLVRKYLPDYFISEFDVIKEKAKSIAQNIIEAIVEKEAFKKLDVPKIEEELKNLLFENSFIQFAYVVDLEGNQITRNITQLYEMDKYSINWIRGNLADRDWFINPIKTGKIYVSNLFNSKITNDLCLTVSHPIWNDKDEMIAIIGLDIKFETLLKIEESIDIERS
jgi:isopropylmalate/homocitrate/citramalate synthase